MTAPQEDGMSAGPAGCGHFRVSHIDRERMVGMLKAAFVQGRLTKDDFDSRVAQALTARTYADLAALAADLPARLIDAAPLRRAARGPTRPHGRVARTGVRWPATVAAAGLLAGILSVALQPPTFTATAELLTSPGYSPAAQVAMGRSAPVMAGALQRLDPGASVQGLRSRVQVKSLTSDVISVSVQGDTASQAVLIADAVANSYVAYVSSISPPGPEPAWDINPPSNAVEQPRSTRLFVSGGLGTLLGALFGALGARAFRRRSRRSGIL
jgi:hypothetical protein